MHVSSTAICTLAALATATTTVTTTAVTTAVTTTQPTQLTVTGTTNSPVLPQIAKTPIYPSLVSVALRCKRWSCGSSQPDPRQQKPPSAAGADGGVPSAPTSSAEFLLLAMACAGAHGRAAALACETSGIHPGLRTLDGGLVVLGRRLREGGRRGGVFGVSVSGDGGASSSSDGAAGWFEPSMVRLRETALKVFEEDVLD